MSKKIFKLAILLMHFYGFAQVPNIEWQKSLGGTSYEYGVSIKQTSDGGYIVGANASSTNGDVTGLHGGYDYWIIKLNSLGAIQWQRCYGGSGADQLNDLKQTADGGYIALGTSNSTNGDVTGNHGLYDAWVLKISNSGTIEWQKSFGGLAYDLVHRICQTSDGGYIFSGETSSIDGDFSVLHGSSDSWIVKLSNTGEQEWQKLLGGIDEEIGQSIQQTTDGGYILTGSTGSNDGDISGHHGSVGNWDYWVVKLSSLGLIEWQKALGGDGSDQAYSITQSLDGSYVVVGFTQSVDGDITVNHGNADYWVIKLSNAGDIIWQKTFGGSNNESAVDVHQTSDGNFIISGNTLSNDGDLTANNGLEDVWTIKISDAGVLLWQKSIGGSDADTNINIEQTLDGGCIMIGRSQSNDGDVSGNHGGQDAWIVKLSSDVLNVNSYSDKKINLYPNPATFTLNIQNLPNINIEKITVKDLTGKEVIVKSAPCNQLNVENLQKGVYLLELDFEEGKQIEKFIKE